MANMATLLSISDPPTHAQPAELCGYSIVETLAPDATYLAIGPGGRGVTLKKLDADCLYRGLLHPDVRERLSRVRELAHTGVANLFGVGKGRGGGGSEDDAWLIWEYVEGKPLAQHAREHCRSPRDLMLLVRELVLTIESLHLQGIVHGSLNGQNAIVASDGTIRLTHVSPLLYTDPSDDAEAIEQTVGLILEERGERAGPLGRLLAEARESKMSLRGLASRLAALADSRDVAPIPPSAAAREERRTRKRAVFGAFLAAVMGVAVAYTVWHATGAPGRELLPTWLKYR
jgi:serine/threonine protein kinase